MAYSLSRNLFTLSRATTATKSRPTPARRESRLSSKVSPQLLTIPSTNAMSSSLTPVSNVSPSSLPVGHTQSSQRSLQVSSMGYASMCYVVPGCGPPPSCHMSGAYCISQPDSASYVNSQRQSSCPLEFSRSSSCFGLMLTILLEDRLTRLMPVLELRYPLHLTR